MNRRLFHVLLAAAVAVIVIVIAFNIFNPSAAEANREAVQQDVMAAAVQAQAIWAKPALMDGAGRNFGNFDEGELLTRLGIPSHQPGETAPLVNENGSYSATVTHEGNGLTITGIPASGEPAVIIHVYRDDEGNWTIGFDGEESD